MHEVYDLTMLLIITIVMQIMTLLSKTKIVNVSLKKLSNFK